MAMAEAAMLALARCPDLVAYPDPIEHRCSFFWKLTQCQRTARRTGTPCAQCGPIGTDEVEKQCIYHVPKQE